MSNSPTWGFLRVKILLLPPGGNIGLKFFWDFQEPAGRYKRKLLFLVQTINTLHLKKSGIQVFLILHISSPLALNLAETYLGELTPSGGSIMDLKGTLAVWGRGGGLWHRKGAHNGAKASDPTDIPLVRVIRPPCWTAPAPPRFRVVGW